MKPDRMVYLFKTLCHEQEKQNQTKQTKNAAISVFLVIYLMAKICLGAINSLIECRRNGDTEKEFISELS